MFDYGSITVAFVVNYFAKVGTMKCPYCTFETRSQAVLDLHVAMHRERDRLEITRYDCPHGCTYAGEDAPATCEHGRAHVGRGATG